MITNFKIFESNSDKKYWRIKISKNEDDSEFIDVQLYKIGMSEKEIKEFAYLHNHFKDVFVGYNSYSTYYYSYTGANDDFFDRNGYEYMGRVEITDEDIADYEMRKNTKKYNL